jgi:PQQ-dependent dehydrogenase (s-GDH family)
MTRRTVAACLVLVTALVGLSAQDRRSAAAASTAFSMREVATGLEGPWEVTWGPDERLWITERTGNRVTRINPADGTKTVALTIPEVHSSHSQDGLLGMALHPELLRGGADYVYLFFTYDLDPGPDIARRGRIRRYTFDRKTETLGDPVNLLSGLPVHTDHVSGRLVFGPDQKLYLSIGDQGSNFGRNYCNANRAQQLPSAAEIAAKDWIKYDGKLLRVNLDGSIPNDNPVLDGVRSHVYTYGHRNIQGLTFGPDGRLYAAEHGPSSDDEVNLIRAGGNYGWPNVAGYKDDRGYVYGNWAAFPSCETLPFSSVLTPPEIPQQKESVFDHPQFVAPLRTFFTIEPGYDFQKQGNATIAPAGLDLYSAKAIPGWANSLLLMGMRTGRVYRLKLSANGMTLVGDSEELFKTTNRYRDSAIAPDGRTVYLATDPEGRTMDADGVFTRELTNGGSILAFTHQDHP